MVRRMLFLILCLLLSPVVVAGELEGVEMPDTASVEGAELELNGMGLRKKMWVKVYVGGLYLESTSRDAAEILGSDQTKQLRMHFLYKKVSKKKLSDAWTDGLKANAADASSLQGSLGKLNGWMEDMVSGDEMTFTSVPGKGLRVSVKGTEKGVIDDEPFSKAFWSIFIGEKPPTGDFKSGLLGG